ncbi:hypothetical protein HDU85_006185 [Gaertneriomyces sp. JEL0708]|nr:hypothetical protein HDU85_006185 [Gaertneriomyces sp. JEL0708]
MNEAYLSDVGPSAIVTGYLFVYNVLSTIAWGYVLYHLSCELLESDFKWGLAYVRCGQLVTWVQTAALLEILHAALGLVKSSPVTTAIQVCSRLLILWGVLYSFDTTLTRSHWAFSSMVIAWSFAELVRYPYYAANLFDSQPSWLLWCRYNFFFILYPIGATSEWILLVRSLGTVYYYSLALYYLYAGCM